MISAFALARIAIGHPIRDGWPSFGSTHVARVAGGAWCVMGATLIALGLAIYGGLYPDMRHGEGP